MKATVSSKGQVTIPEPIRRIGNIHTGTRLDFQMEDDGTIRIYLLTHDISEIKGMVKSKKKKPVSLAEMKKAIQEGAQEGSE